MIRKSVIDVLVGLFMLAGIAALVMLAFKVSGLTSVVSSHYYRVTANFDNVGNLKERAPVTIAGVKIGQVGKIRLDRDTFRAQVDLLIDDKEKDIPTDSSLSILTQGLLGANYVSLTPGFAETTLKAGDKIENTRPALILENLIGQLLFSIQGDNKDKKPHSAGGE